MLLRHRSPLALLPLFVISTWAQAVLAAVQTKAGPNFVVVQGATGMDGCLPRDLAKRTLRDRSLSVTALGETDPQIAVVFSLEVPTCGDLFYAPVANDVRGIGYQNLYEDELFDDSPNAALEGVAFLNDVVYWEAFPDELRRAFLHEVGHRWSTRVHVAGEQPLVLLGRDLEHWSSFLDTSSASGVSPLEGNAWEGTAPLFVATTRTRAPIYSDLDLYLMGAKSSSEVGPFRLLVPDEGELPLDCRGVPLHSASPPQYCGEVELGARAVTYSVEDVIAAEGPRIPEARDESGVVDVGFFFFSSTGIWTTDECEYWRGEVESLGEAFGQATGGRLLLSNVTSGGPDCSALVASLEPEEDVSVGHASGSTAGCSIQPSIRRRGGSEVSWWLFVALVAWLRPLRISRRVRTLGGAELKGGRAPVGPREGRSPFFRGRNGARTRAFRATRCTASRRSSTQRRASSPP